MSPGRPKATKVRCVLFDLDGTLVDTEVSAARAVEQCFTEWGFKTTPEDAAYVTGRTWESALKLLFAKYPVPLPYDQAFETVIQRYRKIIETDLPRIPGGSDAVRALAAGGIALALVSGSHRKEILFALDQLGIRDQFKVILGAEDYPKSKPAPDGYLKAMGMLGVSGAETLVFEDSTAGIDSGLAAGATVVAITCANHFKQDQSRAHHRIEDLRPVTAEWIHALGR